MARVSSTSFKFVLFGALLVALSGLAFGSGASVIKEVTETKSDSESKVKSWPWDSCVGSYESCGPLYPCCDGLTCSWNGNEFRFNCVQTCVGYDQFCGPLSPCCGSMFCAWVPGPNENGLTFGFRCKNN